MAGWKDYLKDSKEKEAEKRKIRPFKNFNFLTKEYLARQKRRFEQLIRKTTESNNEIKLYKTYLNIVKRSFETDNKIQKFRLEHVEQLGITWDCLFLYTKKDVGKTWSVAEYITRLLDKDPFAQVAFIRNSKEESKGFIQMMNNDDHWPTWTNGELVYRKEELKRKKGNISKCTPCGIFAYCSATGMVKWQGGNWNNIRFWYWDECNSVQGGLTIEVFQKVNVFLSSIIRDKSGTERVKGIMTGNLLEQSNVFLERLGVGSKTRLKIFKVHKDNDSRKEVLSTMLYLNTGDLFKGIEDQKGLVSQFLDESEFYSLLSNRPGVYTGKDPYEELDLKDFIPWFCFIHRHKEEDQTGVKASEVDFIFYIYRIPGCARLVIWIDEFKKNNIKPKFNRIFCADRLIMNKHTMSILLEEEEFGEAFIETIAQYLEIGEVWFGWNGSEKAFEKIWPTLETRFIKEEEESI